MDINSIEIRESNNDDIRDIMKVEEQSFGYRKEAELTADLLGDKTAMPLLSLLAFLENKAIGHVLFTRIYIDEVTDQPLRHILAPLAVIPDYQKRGIGGLLIREGLIRLKEMGSEMVFVLGHMEYYPRYGFLPDAGKHGYSAPFPIPLEFADAWMVQALGSGKISDRTGKVICADELNKEEHWRE